MTASRLPRLPRRGNMVARGAQDQTKREGPPMGDPSLFRWPDCGALGAGSRAGVTLTVVAQIGPRRRVVGAEALLAIGYVTAAGSVGVAGAPTGTIAGGVGVVVVGVPIAVAIAGRIVAVIVPIAVAVAGGVSVVAVIIVVVVVT